MKRVSFAGEILASDETAFFPFVCVEFRGINKILNILLSGRTSRPN